MRYRFVFLTGLGAGFLLGARAGRERYDQLVRVARKVADSPAVQQAAGAAQAQASGLARAAAGRLSERMPRIAASARSRLGGGPQERRGAPGYPETNGQAPYESAPGGTSRPGQR